MTQPDERGYYPPDEPGNLPPRTTHSPAPPPLPSRAVVPLEYGLATDPAERRRARRKTLGRVALGCVGYIVLSAAWFGFGNTLFAYGVVGGSGSLYVLWGGWVAMTLALLGGALYLRLRFRIRGYGFGILTALG